jgi:hypothetical protein
MAEGWNVDTLLEHMTALRQADCRATEQRFRDQQTAVDAALKAAKEAVLKAETAAERRFESVNEFRETLGDQQRTLMPRQEAEIRFKQLDDRVAELAQINARLTGARTGGREMWAYVAAGVGMLIGIVSIVLAVLRSMGETP